MFDFITKKKIFRLIDKNDPDKLLAYIKKKPKALEDKHDNMSVMHYAACHNKDKSIQTLIDHGVPCDEKDDWGNTPFLTACGNGSTNTAKVLIAHNIDIFATNSYGIGAIHKAATSAPHFIKDLVELGLDVNLQDKDGQTPLYYVSCWSWDHYIPTLLENGADASIRGNSGLSPIDRVDENRYKALMKQSLSGRYILENDHLVSITEITTINATDITTTFNFNAEIVISRDNKSGHVISEEEFTKTKRKKQLEEARAFLAGNTSSEPKENSSTVSAPVTGSNNVIK